MSLFGIYESEFCVPPQCPVSLMIYSYILTVSIIFNTTNYYFLLQCLPGSIFFHWFPSFYNVFSVIYMSRFTFQLVLLSCSIVNCFTSFFVIYKSKFIFLTSSPFKSQLKMDTHPSKENGKHKPAKKHFWSTFLIVSGSHQDYLPRPQRRLTWFSLSEMHKSCKTITGITKQAMEIPTTSTRGFSN